MIKNLENGNIGIKGASYDLLIRDHIIDVIICGTAFARKNPVGKPCKANLTFKIILLSFV